MFSFFRRNKNTANLFADLQTDMHSHLIPWIDDGAKNLRDSIELIEELKLLGFSKIITTPHIMQEYYPNTRTTILEGLKTVQKEIKNLGLDIALSAASEYFIDENFEHLINKDESLLCFSDKKILVEYSTLSPPHNGLGVIFLLLTKGYQPVIAHPERYIYFGKDLEKFKALKNAGCNFQLNLLSLSGYYGGKQKEIANLLINEGMIDYLGTDLHNKSQLEFLKKIRPKKLTEILKKNPIKNNLL